MRITRYVVCGASRPTALRLRGGRGEAIGGSRLGPTGYEQDTRQVHRGPSGRVMMQG